VFRDADHITATYATTLSDVLLKELGPFAKPR
jgi:hypothetical protein